MARIINNSFLEGVSGMVGKNFVVKRTPRGGVMSNKPKKRKKNSPLQDQQVSRFTYGIQYSRECRKLPRMKELYATGITLKKFSAHHVAVSDFLHAPEIHEIDVKDYHGNPGDIIRVRATDDFKVTSVKVIITDADGNVIETGEAMPRGRKGLWRMAATVPHENVAGIVIKVEAKDVAGNTTKATFSVATGKLIILPDPYKENSERLSGPAVVRDSDHAHSQAVDGGTTVEQLDKAFVDQEKGEVDNRPDHIEDRSKPVHAKGGEVQGQAILDVLRAAFPDLKVEVVEQGATDDRVATKGGLRILI
jgi:hypothetical protein